MRVTVVNEGDQVMFNCTPTNPELTATFEVRGGNSELLERFPPVGNVWSFPASLMDSGFYECSAQFESQFTQGTFLLVYPNAGTRNNAVTTFCTDRDTELSLHLVVCTEQPPSEPLSFICLKGNVTVWLVTNFTKNRNLIAFFRCVPLFSSNTHTPSTVCVTSVYHTLILLSITEERDVVFYDFRESAILPDSYIMLNVPQREGLEFACISRAGSVSISSENQTVS